MKTVFIYTLTDPLTHEIKYVGYTSKSLKQRLSSHITSAVNENKTHNHRWVNKTIKEGRKPLITLVDEVPAEDWSFWEIYWIDQIRQWGFSLNNHCKGGLGCLGWKHSEKHLETVRKPVLMYSYYGVFLKTFPSIVEATNETGCKDISYACNGKLISSGGYAWRFKTSDNFPKTIKIKHKYKKKVLQINAKTFKVIKIWESVSSVQKSLKISHVSKVCNQYKSYKTLKGFTFRYTEEYLDYKVGDIVKGLDVSKIKIQKKVVQIDPKTNKALKTWDGVREAMKATGSHHIVQVCKNQSGHKTSGGFIWKYHTS